MRILKLCVPVLVPVLAACASTTTPRTDEQFGSSLNSLKALQTSNPAASQDTDPVRGMDGKAAGSAMRAYHESFRQPASGGMSASPAGASGGAAK